MIGEKRKRESAPLPPMTIVTRSSARRQSIETHKQSSSATSFRKETRPTARSRRTITPNSSTSSRSLRTRAAHSHSSLMVNRPEGKVVVETAQQQPPMEISKETGSAAAPPPRRSGRVVTKHYGGSKHQGLVASVQDLDQDQEVPYSSKRICAPAPAGSEQAISSKLSLDSAEQEEDDFEEEEEEEEEEDDEMPKFEYESKYKDELEAEQMEDDNTNMEDNMPLPNLTHRESVSKKLSADTDLSGLDSLFSANTSECGPRWPIDKQDESTSFSILTNPSHNSSSSSSKPAFLLNTQLDSEQESFESPSIDDFVNYESAVSLTDDDGELDDEEEDEDEVSSEQEQDNGSIRSGFSSGASSPVLRPTMISTSSSTKNIPLCGYRDRNQAPTQTKVHNGRFMAALSLAPPSPTEPLGPSRIANAYQQALVAATGLNRRSLWSGKAREMVGVGAVLGDFLA